MSELYTVPVRGFRRFKIGYGKTADGKRFGYLTGITYREPWDCGVNTAVCKNSARSSVQRVAWAFGDRRSPAPVHGMESCSCGFYAVYDPVHAARGPVSGMIEGWGKVIDGPDGFRCEKAKIVALQLPPLPKKGCVRLEIQGRCWVNVPEDLLPPEIISMSPHGLDDVENAGLREAFGREAPDVPIFDTETEMLGWFPPERGEGPVEPTPNPQREVFVPLNAGRRSGRGLTYYNTNTSNTTTPTELLHRLAGGGRGSSPGTVNSSQAYCPACRRGYVGSVHVCGGV